MNTGNSFDLRWQSKCRAISLYWCGRNMRTWEWTWWDEHRLLIGMGRWAVVYRTRGARLF